MKKTKMTMIIASLILSGCQFTNNVSTSTTSSSSSNSNSSVSTNSSITTSSDKVSSSSSVDKSNWIKNGSEDYAINNFDEWVYSNDEDSNILLAEVFEETLFFNYSNATKWNSVELFYHDSSLKENDTYIISFEIISNKGGKITVNGIEKEVINGTQKIEVTSQYASNKASVSIQFGLKDSGTLASENDIMISDFEIKAKKNAKNIIERALENNNYTLTLTTGAYGYAGVFKYFSNATYFTWNNSIDKVNGDSGYAEDNNGVFGFNKKMYEGQEHIVTNSDYYQDETGNVKGLYSSTYCFTYKGCNGIPSLHSLNLSKFDYDLVMNEPTVIKDGSSLKALAYLLDDQYYTFYYRGVKNASVRINSDNNLEFTFESYGSEISTFVLSDINNTSDELVNNFINSEDFGPNYTSIEIDEELKAILKDINGSNYVVLKPNDCKFVMNEKYIYNESINEETNEKEASGYISLIDGIYEYSIVANEVTLGEKVENATLRSLGGLSHVSYFKDATSYSKVDDHFEFLVPESDYSFYSFGTSWLGATVQKLEKIKLTRNNSNITIGAYVKSYSDEQSNYSWMNLEISDIGSAKVDLLDAFLSL